MFMCANVDKVSNKKANVKIILPIAQTLHGAPLQASRSWQIRGKNRAKLLQCRFIMTNTTFRCNWMENIIYFSLSYTTCTLKPILQHNQLYFNVDTMKKKCPNTFKWPQKTVDATPLFAGPITSRRWTLHPDVVGQDFTDNPFLYMSYTTVCLTSSGRRQRFCSQLDW